MEHRKYLLEALLLAEERRGFCSPNPSVGALLVKEHQVIGRGSHFAAGHEHAEVAACQGLDNKNLADSTLYVTLEPCCHWGKTPPCTDLILRRGINKVVYAFRDPNPIVSGKGETLLRQQGVDCQQLEVPEINQFYRSYVHWVINKLPWITTKLAISFDGKIANPQAAPVQITGPEAQGFTHQSRRRSDAILTSINTILNDNPSLNVRIGKEVTSKSLYVLDSKLQLPLHAKVFETCSKITVFYSEADSIKIAHLEEQGVNCRQVTKDDVGLALNEVVRHIGGDGIHDLWVEAGGKLFCTLAEKRLVHKSFLYIAPKLLGQSAYSGFNLEENLFAKAKKVTWASRGSDAICEIDW